MEFLYRGVNQQLYEKLHGELRPKQAGKKFASFLVCGAPHAVCGSGVMCGESVANEAIYHQWTQSGFPTSGISTSPFVERARFYALGNNEFSIGYIYTLSVRRLNELGVSIYRVSDIVKVPAVPEDNEHILVAKDFNCIPSEAILDICKVTSSI